MSEPKRLLESSSAASRLLRAAVRDNPQPRTAERAALALGLGSAAAGAASAASGAAMAAVSGSVAVTAPTAVAAGTAAGGAAVGVTSLAAKWVVVGFIGGGLAASGAASFVGSRPTEAPSEQQSFERSSNDRPIAPKNQVSASTAARKAAADDDGASELLSRQTATPPVKEKPAPPAARTAREPPPGKPASPTPAVAQRDDSKGRLGRDLSHIDATRRALWAGDAAEALARLNTYENARETNFFDREATILRIEALVQQGQRERALALASEYLRRFPGDVHAARLRALSRAAENPKKSEKK